MTFHSNDNSAHKANFASDRVSPSSLAIANPDMEPILPPTNTMRWNTKRKTEVLNGIRHGMIDLDTACYRYRLTLDEIIDWYVLLRRHGPAGLRVTQTRHYREQEKRAMHDPV